MIVVHFHVCFGARLQLEVSYITWTKEAAAGEAAHLNPRRSTARDFRLDPSKLLVSLAPLHGCMVFIGALDSGSAESAPRASKRKR